MEAGCTSDHVYWATRQKRWWLPGLAALGVAAAILGLVFAWLPVSAQTPLYAVSNSVYQIQKLTGGGYTAALTVTLKQITQTGLTASPGVNMNFTTTVGDVSPTSATTDAQGQALTLLTLPGAGSAVVSVTVPFEGGFMQSGIQINTRQVTAPSVGKPGQSMSISGSGFPAGEVVSSLQLLRQEGLSYVFDRDIVPANSISAGSDGQFAVTWLVPADIAVGQYKFSINTPQYSNSSLFTQISNANLSLTPSRAASGGTVTISGTGFQASKRMSLSYSGGCPGSPSQVLSGAGLPITTTSTRTFAWNWSIPASLAAGTYQLNGSNATGYAANAILTITSGPACPGVTPTPTPTPVPGATATPTPPPPTPTPVVPTPTPTPVTPPDAPQSLSGQINGTRAVLWWMPVDGAASYWVFQAKNGGAFERVANPGFGTPFYTATGLTPGASYSFYVMAAAGNVVSAPTAQIDLTVTQGAIAVQVDAPADVDLTGYRLVAWSDFAGYGAAAALTGPGAYNLAPLVPSFDYRVQMVDSTGAEMVSRQLVSVTAQQTTTVSLPPAFAASFSVRVVEPSWQFVPGLKLRVQDATTGAFLRSDTTSINAGNISPITNLQAGQSVSVTVTGMGQLLYQAASQSYTLARGTNSVTLQLQPLARGTLAGRLVDSSGSPVQGAMITAVQQIDGRDWSFSAVTGSDGSYALQALAGAAQVSAASGWQYGFAKTEPMSTNVAAGSTANLDLTLRTLVNGTVTVSLSTKYLNEAWQGPLPVDARVAEDYDLHVRTPQGDVYGAWPYPLAIRAFPGQTMQVCINGSRVKLPRACQDVQLGASMSGNAVFRLEQAGLIRGRVIDSTTGQPSTYWSGNLYAVDSGGKRTPVKSLFGRSPDVEVDVPVGGAYVVAIGNYEAQIEVPAGQSVDLGQILVGGSGTFAGQTGNSLIAQPPATAPGTTVTLRASYKNSSPAVVNGASLLVDIPSGTTFVTGSLTLNGQPASDVASGTARQVSVGDVPAGASGAVSYQVQLDAGLLGTAADASARIRFHNAGNQTEEVLGTARIAVQSLTIEVSPVLDVLTTTVKGQAPPGSTISVYDGNQLLGKATAAAGGSWRLQITLSDLPSPSYHRLEARAETSTGAVYSANAAVRYDANRAKLVNFCMQQTGGRRICFDPASGIARFPYVVVPSRSWRFDLQFSDPNAVTNVVVAMDGSGGGRVMATLGDDGLYHASLSTTSFDLGDLSISYKERSTLQSLRQPVLTESQVRQLMPARLQDFVLQSNSSVTDGTQTTVRFPQANNAEMTITFTSRSGVAYTPTADELAWSQRTGIPVYGFAQTVSGDEDRKTFTIQGYVPESVAQALESPATGNSLAPASSVRAQQVSSRFVQTAIAVNNFQPMNTAVNAAGQVSNALSSAANNWYGADEWGRLQMLHDLLSDPALANGLSAAEYAEYTAQLDYIRSNIPWQNMMDAAFNVLNLPVPGGVVGGLGANAFTGALNAALDGPANQALDALYGSMRADYQRIMRKKQMEEERKVAKPTYLPDPSGYVYEALPQNRLSGATATVLQQDPTTSEWSAWKAEDYGQDNPQTTDSQGRYGWGVTPGNWRVAFQKDGYADAQSEVVVVPPPRTDVNVGMVSLSAPQVLAVTAVPDGTSVDVAFSQYIITSTLTSATVRMTDSTGQDVAGSVSPANAVPDANGRPLALAARFIPGSPLDSGGIYTLTVSSLVQNYGNRPVAAEIVRSFTVPAAAAAPAVTGISPSAGSASGGDQVTISGSGFTGATAVHFGTASAADFKVASDLVITATVPAGTGSINVTITGPGGASTTGAGSLFQYDSATSQAAPVITGFSPTVGAGAGGTQVSITGTGFTGTTAVGFGEALATGITVVSDTQITVVAPAYSGSVRLQVTTPAGTSSPSASVFQCLTSASKTLGTDGGTVSTIGGTATVVVAAGTLSAGQSVSLTEVTTAQFEIPVPVTYALAGTAVRLDLGASGAGVASRAAGSIAATAPVTLTLSYDAHKIPSASSPVIYRDGASAPLPTTVKDGKVTASVTSSGSYAVVAPRIAAFLPLAARAQSSGW